MTAVIVIGSGAAGAAAALAAAEAGARVTLLERAEALGGTTTYSGSIAWLPVNHRAAEAGLDDDEADARRYLAELGGVGDADAALAATFVREARPTAEAIERTSALRWRVLPYPDYHAERPGGRLGGRSLEVEPLGVREDVATLVRKPLHLPRPVTYAEIVGRALDEEEIARREAEGVLTMGRALVGGLVQALVERGGTVRPGVRARRLTTDARGGVTGVETDDGALPGRVVLASGGFERDPALVAAFLRGPMRAPTGAPANEGDAVRMLLGAGAALGNMSEAWWCPAYRIPTETYEGLPFHRALLTERSRPRCLMVDRRGRRFASEAQNYNDLGRALHEFDPAGFDFPRDPSWLVFDAAYRRRYHLGPLRRDAPDPDWLARAGDLDGLAGAIGVPGRELRRTVQRFNALAAAGHDEDFGRGSYPYERFMGDQRAPHPSLGPVEDPPFYAVQVLPGCLGTKGGARTDDAGRVQRADGSGSLPGLYAAGNAAASPFGLAYPGAGGTIGPALVFGTRAGRAAAGD